MRNIRNNLKINNDGTITINGGTFDKILAFSFEGNFETPWTTVTVKFDVDGDFIVDLPAVHHDSKEEEKNNENDDA